MDRPARPLPMMATLSLGAEGEGGPGSSGKRDLSGTSLRPTLRTRLGSLLVGPPTLTAEAVAVWGWENCDWWKVVRKMVVWCY